MSEMHTPHPGSRTASVAHAASAEGGQLHDAETVPPLPAIEAVPVRLDEAAPVIPAPTKHGSMSTVTIPASATNAPSVRRLLPQDFQRRVAYIQPLDGPVVIATSEAQAQDPSNLNASYAGSYGSGWSPPITHAEEVWACNLSTSVAVHVSVMVETGGPA